MCYANAIALQLIFGKSNAKIMSELQHWFDGLPIHKLVCYQSYHQGVLQGLLAAINMRSGQHRTLRYKLDPTSNQQDCLGMTPLHILACSSVHDMEVYHLIIEEYPTNLITEDKWGAIPLLYAFWGAAPAEISSSCSRAINHSTPAMYSTGQWWRKQLAGLMRQINALRLLEMIVLPSTSLTPMTGAAMDNKENQDKK